MDASCAIVDIDAGKSGNRLLDGPVRAPETAMVCETPTARSSGCDGSWVVGRIGRRGGGWVGGSGWT